MAQVSQGRTGGGAVAGLTENLLPRLRAAAATTPGRLTIAMVGLVLLSVITGVVGLLTVQDRANKIDDLARYREPVSAAAQEIYRSLSDADATSASAFLSGAVEPPSMLQRYQTDIGNVGSALSVAATDSADAADAAEPLSILTQQIPVYTGLVQRAAANNEQGFPLGSAYLREADSLMRSQLLPAAQRLYTVDTTMLSSEQDDATGFPWLAVVLVAGLLVALFFTHRFISRRTNRVINVGLLVASISIVVAVLWAGVGLVLETVHLDTGRSAGSDEVGLLAQATTKALQARTDEMLTLVARGGQDYDAEYQGEITQLGGKDGSGGLLGQIRSSTSDPVLTGQVNTAIAEARSWFAIHQKVTTSSTDGSYADAVNLALGADNNGEALTFDRLKASLDAAFQQGRKEFFSETETGGTLLSAMPLGMLVLSVAAAIGSAVGIWKRLREYR